jgi:hypothetical protein
VKGLILGPALAALAPVARADFIDEFNGSALAPWWQQPPPSNWVYNVSGGMLNVLDLTYPNNPKSPENFATIVALFDPVPGDFQATVRMGWDPRVGGARAMTFDLGDTAGHLLASFGYNEFVAGGPYVQVEGG